MTPSSASLARWRDTVLLGVPVAAASVLTEGKHLPLRSANATRFCSVQCRWRRTVRYRSRVTGTKASIGSPLAAEAARRERLDLGAPRPWQESRLALTALLGEPLSARTEIPPVRRDAGPAAFGGFLLLRGLGLAASRKSRSRAPDCAR